MVKLQKGKNMKRRWTDLLTEEIYNRLANCRSIKKDIIPLTQAKWNSIKENGRFTKEDALIFVLELLDCNGCEFDISTDEYNEILESIH